MSDRSVNQGRILRNLMRLMDVTCGQSLYEVLPCGVQVWLPEQGKGVTRLPMMDIYERVDFGLRA